VTSSWFFLSTLNYDARSTTHQMCFNISSLEINPGITFQALRVRAVNGTFCTPCRVCSNRTHPSTEPDKLST